MGRRLAQVAMAAGAVALLSLAWQCDGPWFDRHVFLPQQFFISASHGIVVASRVAAAALAMTLLVAIPFVRSGAAVGRGLLAALLAAPAAEGLLRWRLPGLVHPEQAMAMDGLVTTSLRYGSALAPALDRVQRMSGREIRVRTDAEGRRISGAPVDPAAPSLVFAGESSVAGVGLQWEETFPAILGARLRLQILNLGSPAWRLDQSWLRLKDALPRLEQPVAVVGLFMPGLVGRSFGGRRHPVARPSESSGLELLPPETPRRLERLALVRLWKHLYWSDAAVEEGMRSVGATLRDMAALAKERGVPCVFLVTANTPRWMIGELFESAGLDFVAANVPEEELLADGHPGPRGSIRLADALEARLRTRIAKRFVAP